MNNMSLDQALNNIYNAARLAPLNAEQHELIRKCAEQIAEALKPNRKCAEQIAEALKPKDEPKKE